MLEDSLQELLKNISISAIGELTKHSEYVPDFLYVMSQAVTERAIYGQLQFEGEWKDSRDGRIYTEFKLSPSLCSLASKADMDLSQLSWRLVHPSINTDEVEKCSEWLLHSKILVEADSDYEFDCLKSLLNK